MFLKHNDEKNLSIKNLVIVMTGYFELSISVITPVL